MSRCFPFPPPGYVLNAVRDVAMIESIKGAEEEKCKKEQRRKERKRDKNEKKDKKDKEKKEKKDKKDKKRKEREGESEKHSHKRRRKEEVAKDVQNNLKVENKLKESENVSLEKSSLTVERGLLQSTSQNSCDSTLNSNEKEKKLPHNTNDITLNSNELPKEKEKQSLNGRHNNNNNNNNDSESIIRIRLPIRRPKDPEVMMMMMTNKDPCPSRDIKLDTSQSVVTRDQQQHPCSTSATQHVSKPHEEKRKHHTSTRKHKEKKLPSTSQETCQPSSGGLCRLCPPSMAVQFLNVVENWVPSRVEMTNSEEDECWWLMKKPSSNKFDTERCKQVNNETKQVISTSLEWPRARLLQEADVYVLPYTVPF